MISFYYRTTTIIVKFIYLLSTNHNCHNLSILVSFSCIQKGTDVPFYKLTISSNVYNNTFS